MALFTKQRESSSATEQPRYEHQIRFNDGKLIVQDINLAMKVIPDMGAAIGVLSSAKSMSLKTEIF